MLSGKMDIKSPLVNINMKKNRFLSEPMKNFFEKMWPVMRNPPRADPGGLREMLDIKLPLEVVLSISAHHVEPDPFGSRVKSFPTEAEGEDILEFRRTVS